MRRMRINRARSFTYAQAMNNERRNKCQEGKCGVLSGSAASIYALILIVIAGVNRIDAQVRTATISGTATDSSGAVLVGAKIEVKNLGTGITQSAITDSQGRYSIPDLSVGDYEVRASATGFQTVVRTGITLTVGSQPVADFTLPTGAQTETVTVVGEAAQVETRTDR